MPKDKPAEHLTSILSEEESWRCRVCGLLSEDIDKPWGGDGKTPSFNICNCCGCEFGYPDGLLSGIRKFRENWIAKGALWRDEKARPENWNLEEQLKKIPEVFR